MSKAILVQDMPESCYGCDLTYQDANGIYCGCTKEDVGNYIACRPDRCPLRELPEKEDLKELEKYSLGEDYIWHEGWNACIDAIEGNGKEQKMDTEKMINELKAVVNKHRNDKLYTFSTNITAMCKDVIPKLEKLKEYEDLELTPEQIKEMDKLYTEKCEQVNELKESVEELKGKNEKPELKTCPFCGGEAQLNYEKIPGEDKGFWAQVICQKCHGRSGGTWAGSYNAAERKEKKAWNRRADK